MNREWSEKNKRMQVLLGKERTYKEGIELLLALREELFQQITQLVDDYPAEAFYQMPFPNAKGYHNKTLAYSVWHIFRIEDIVMHTLIARDEQILMTGDYQKKIGSPVMTTGNELQDQEITEFSKKLNVRALYDYAREVMLSSNAMLSNLAYAQMKTGFSESDKKKLAESGCVSTDGNAFWLIDYWCSKDVRGLLKMPFSRHWITHIEAMLRISASLRKGSAYK